MSSASRTRPSVQTQSWRVRGSATPAIERGLLLRPMGCRHVGAGRLFGRGEVQVLEKGLADSLARALGDLRPRQWPRRGTSTCAHRGDRQECNASSCRQSNRSEGWRSNPRGCTRWHLEACPRLCPRPRHTDIADGCHDSGEAHVRAKWPVASASPTGRTLHEIEDEGHRSIDSLTTLTVQSRLWAARLIACSPYNETSGGASSLTAMSIRGLACLPNKRPSLLFYVGGGLPLQSLLVMVPSGHGTFNTPRHRSSRNGRRKDFDESYPRFFLNSGRRARHWSRCFSIKYSLAASATCDSIRDTKSRQSDEVGDGLWRTVNMRRSGPSSRLIDVVSTIHVLVHFCRYAIQRQSRTGNRK